MPSGFLKTNKNSGENLIFLISQPRSGSTLLQRILGAHDDIYTVGEPWLLLYPLHGITLDGVSARYNVEKSEKALSEFKQYLPRQGEEFYEGMRLMYSHIYNSVLKNSGKSLFLDKTPRYYYIAEEVWKLFPAAKFIFLYRDPVSVILSVLNTWIRTSRLYLYDIHDDLFLAPRMLIQAEKTIGNDALRVKYESLLENTEHELRKIMCFLNIEYDASIINYNSKSKDNWLYGDKKSVYKYDRPTRVNKPLNETCLSPQMWRFASEYLEFLGPELVSESGYSYDSLREQLDEIRPPAAKLLFTISLSRSSKRPGFLSDSHLTFMRRIMSKFA